MLEQMMKLEFARADAVLDQCPLECNLFMCRPQGLMLVDNSVP